MSDEEREIEDQEQTDLSDPTIIGKFTAAGDVANFAIERIVEACQPGKKIVELCQMGDDTINAELVKLYGKKGKVEKGVAFPTCVSVNACAGHFSPLSGDVATLASGDVAKIDLGVHVDGFVVVTARTVVVNPPSEGIAGRKADVIAAARAAMNAAVHMIRPGTKNTEISEVIRRVAAAYHVNPMEAVLSHQMKRYLIDGPKVIMNKPTQDQRVEECTIEENEVWGLDVVMTTGEGKARERDTRTTIFKRALDTHYLLKLKASRHVLKEVNSKFPTFPFTLRALDEKTGRLGITEMVTHGLVDPYPVLYERPVDIVAQFKTTVLVTASGTTPMFDPQVQPCVKSSITVEDSLVQSALALPVCESRDVASKKKKAKKGAAAAAAAETSAAAAPAATTPADSAPAPAPAATTTTTAPAAATSAPTPMQI